MVYALGRKEYGRLGLGENCSDAIKPTVIPILKDIKCVNIACGSTVSFAVTEDGTYYRSDLFHILISNFHHLLSQVLMNRAK